MLVFVLMIGLMLSGTYRAQAQEISVATVNMQEVLMVHPSVQEAQQELQQRQMEMMAEMEELDEEEQQAQQQQMQQEMQMLQQELLEGAIADVEEDIERISQELGYDVVINEQGIITGEEVLAAENITEQILEEFNGEMEMEPDF